MRALLLIVLVAAGCGSPVPSSDPVARTTRLAGYEMTFTLPRSVWSTGESIIGEATLTRVEGAAVTVSVAGSSLLRFQFEAEGFDYRPVMTLECSSHEIAPGAPVKSAIQKPGGAFDPDDPTDQVYLRWFREDGIFLPAGEWRITATASFREEAECAGRPHLLSLPVTITVVE